MTDLLRYASGYSEVQKRFRDMGDTTFAEVVASVGGFRSQITVTRPANATPYTAGDVLGAAAAVVEFTNIGPAGGHIMLTSADLRIDVAAVPLGMTSVRWHLYNVTPPSALADNAPWDLPAGDRAGYVGYIDVGSPVDLGGSLFVQADGINKQVKLADGSTSLFAYMVSNGGFTPAGNSEVYTPCLRTVAL